MTIRLANNMKDQCQLPPANLHALQTSPEVVRGLRRALATKDDTLTTFAAQALRMIAERDNHVTVELRSALPELRRLLGTRKDVDEQVARVIANIERREL